ncbi:MAG: hypothetical protein ACK5LT_09670 [Lachnospirales bacterium]
MLRRVLIVPTIYALALSIIGCGQTGEANVLNITNKNSSTSSSTEINSETSISNENISLDDQSGTHTVSTPLGDIEVPNNPQRIVTSYLEGDVIALGGNVVGCMEPF